MAVPFSNTKLRAPRGFRNILEGFSREILRSQPSDIYAFGSLYFEKLLQIRAESGIDPVEFGAQEEDRFYNNKVYARDAVLHENDQEREMAALKIQTKYRQYTAKKVVREKREERAAVKIQACFRGHLDRKYVHGIKCAAEHVETEAKEMARVEDEEEEEKEGDSPSKIMVADFPDKRGKLEDTVREQASVQLEKKGDAVSEEQQQKDEKETKEKKEGKKEDEEEDKVSQNDETSDMDEAATRIQAGMRGMLTRMTLKGQLIPGEETEQVEKKVEAEGEKETEEKKEDEEYKESQNDETSDMDEAATRIQAGMRGMLTRMTLKGQLIPGEETGEDEKDGQKEEGEKEESGTKEEEKEESGTKEEEKEESGTKEEEKEESGTKDANEENDTEEKE